MDNFTPKEHVAVILACWGAFLGLIPPVFLTDEIEGLDPKDMLYAGALAIVGLVVPIITVPTATGTVIKAWSDRALDIYRLNLSDEPAGGVERPRPASPTTSTSAGLSGPALQQETGTGPGRLRDGRERRPRVPQRPAVPQPDDARHRPGGRRSCWPTRRGDCGAAARVRLHLITAARRVPTAAGDLHSRARP